MIVANKPEFLAGDYTIVIPNILLNNQTNKLYKSSNFKPWAIFSSADTLESTKVVTLTPYNPIFLVIKEAELILSKGDNKMKELDELFSGVILKLFKEQAKSVCDTIQAGGDDYYKISQTKILDILEKKFEQLTTGLSSSDIKLQTSALQKEGDLLPVKLYSIDIMKQDVSKDLIDKLVKQRLKIQMPVLNLQPVFVDDYKQQKQQYNYQASKKKSSTTPKLSAKQQNLKKQANQSVPLLNFFKKKTQTQPLPVTQDIQQ